MNNRIADDIIMTGEYVNLTCLAETCSQHQFDLSYEWYHNGSVVSAGLWNLVADNNVLHVAGVMRGTVQCIASNRAGSVSVSVNLCELKQFCWKC